LLKVNQKVPHPDWPAQPAITWGTALSSKQFGRLLRHRRRPCLQASAGALLSVAKHPPSATFTPAETVDYATVTVTNTRVVSPAPYITM